MSESIPMDAWRVVLEFAPAVGVWVGLALRAASSGTRDVVQEAVWRTEAGGVFLGRVLRRCAARRAPLPSWILEIEPTLLMARAHSWSRDANRATRTALRAGHAESAVWLARVRQDRQEQQVRTNALADAVVAGALGTDRLGGVIDALRVDERLLVYDAAAAAPSHEAAVDAMLALSRARPALAALCERALEARLGRLPLLENKREERAAVVSALRRDCAPVLLAAMPALHPAMLSCNTGPRCARAIMDWVNVQPERSAMLRRLVELGGGRHWPVHSVANLSPPQAMLWLRFVRRNRDRDGYHRYNPEVRAACHPSDAVRALAGHTHEQFSSAELRRIMQYAAKVGDLRQVEVLFEELWHRNELFHAAPVLCEAGLVSKYLPRMERYKQHPHAWGRYPTLWELVRPRVLARHPALLDSLLMRGGLPEHRCAMVLAHVHEPTPAAMHALQSHSLLLSRSAHHVWFDAFCAALRGGRLRVAEHVSCAFGLCSASDDPETVLEAALRSRHARAFALAWSCIPESRRSRACVRQVAHRLWRFLSARAQDEALRLCEDCD